MNFLVMEPKRCQRHGGKSTISGLWNERRGARVGAISVGGGGAKWLRLVRSWRGFIAAGTIRPAQSQGFSRYPSRNQRQQRPSTAAVVAEQTTSPIQGELSEVPMKPYRVPSMR